MKVLLLFSLLMSIICICQSSPVEIPPDPEAGLPVYKNFNPSPPPRIQVKLEERRCDNSFTGGVPPCLVRPWLPPFSYSTTVAYNGEYRRKRNVQRTWRFLKSSRN